ncbi:NADH-quinone oxidoreductase subunit J [Streptomyces chitinivorans]|uniref:NADH-quinone oxidoreductase subunit J n=1 Tax=Streptomyces chitinivorans TaxID=1257027 RepID=A0ABW7HL89_9ACTN|nr:NADH-quinone oxidoreductase subunit J [Streptomyces chitinivorans]MDH2412034.1 NADH-quinone oxidoreductase subunit J [Streptomyces chitinivorans]
MQTALFCVLAVVAVASGAAVFTVDSMARATYALALSFVAAGASLLLLDLAYLGVVTILMMVMEMAIMAVFMIMFMMNPAGLVPMSMLHNKRGASAVSGGVFLALGAVALLVPWPERRGAPPADPTRAAGEAIMGSKMLVMTGVGAVLFTTIVAALVLAVSRGRYGDEGAEDGHREGRGPHDGHGSHGGHDTHAGHDRHGGHGGGHGTHASSSPREDAA